MKLWAIFRESFQQLKTEEKIKLKLCGWYFLTLPLLTIYRALVFKTIWGWFVVPFLGLPILTLPLALGLGMVAGAYTGFAIPIRSRVEIEKFTAMDLRQNILSNWLAPVVGLLLAALIRHFL